jgi:serine/threonine protein kinase
MSIAPEQLKDCLAHIGVMTDTAFVGVCDELHAAGAAVDGARLLKELQARGVLTTFQIQETEAGRGRDLRVGNYLILNRIGVGGMGTVYKAWHLRMCRVVAIKIMRRDRTQSDQFVTRFLREVQAVARLNHPNIIAAFDAGESSLGDYLVMEYVNGADFSKIVKNSGPLEIDEAIDALPQTAEALAFAHDHGVVHRDIKPANLMRDASGMVKVADLGLAQFEAKSLVGEVGEAFTESGIIAGTIDYMAPEQAMNVRGVDHRADMYSLGCTLFFLLTGQPVFVEPTMAARILAHRDKTPPPLRDFRPEAPELLDAIFQRLVAKQAEARYASMKEVIENLKLLSDSGEEGKRSWDASSSTVILAEPSKFQGKVIQSYLQQIGINDVYRFGSGQEVIEALGELPATLILTTMQLADMTGIELAQRVRDDLTWMRVAIVLMTSSQVAPEYMASLERLVVSQVLEKPFDQAQLAAALESAMTAQDASPRVAGMEDKQVLIVDDSSMWRLRLQRVLEALGFTNFVTAADGVQAVAHLQDREFDLIVTDYHMPNMNGKELVAHIRQNRSQQAVPILVVTTEYDPLKLGEVHQVGASAICHKSSDPQLLRNIVMRLLM